MQQVKLSILHIHNFSLSLLVMKIPYSEYINHGAKFWPISRLLVRVRGGESVLGRIRGFLVLGMKDKNFNQLKIVQTRHVAYQTKAYCLSFSFLQRKLKNLYPLLEKFHDENCLKINFFCFWKITFTNLGLQPKRLKIDSRFFYRS